MTRTRIVAALDAALILPAALFMMALFLRSAFPPGAAAEHVVAWYVGQVWALWVLLLALPSAAFVTGTATLVRSGALHALREHVATLFVAATTLAAGAILAVVVLHMAAN